MARVNVYLPDDLAAEAKAAELNVSALTQAAIRAALGASATDAWLAALADVAPVAVSRVTIERALVDAKSDLWGDA